MEVDFDLLTPYQRYKLMTGLIVPRPIALVTTINAQGVVNAAPFSLFNMIGEEPPLVLISLNRSAAGSLKDTAVNILANEQFVVHIADEAMAQAMHDCGTALPPDQSEIDLVGLSTTPSSAVAPPRIVEAPVAFECQLSEKMETESRHIFIGRVLRLHARDGLLDMDKHHVRLDDYLPVARFGSDLYVRTRDRFKMEGKK
ncbi:flavin reductase family protein [Pigmentiphaga aceris]|uniref:Flavin reductase family protein n=1 Tax=Pigmentiphaga aceris TaxID=1940612 RepID=A0A5C0AWS7_9BURK|nr:flavin reductase family protein [Pigmentiphaga aceris]QEI05843.1 flavin reductase family protein [Pigmentiphaga aceris]